MKEKYGKRGDTRWKKRRYEVGTEIFDKQKRKKRETRGKGISVTKPNTSITSFKIQKIRPHTASGQ